MVLVVSTSGATTMENCVNGALNGMLVCVFVSPPKLTVIESSPPRLLPENQYVSV